jgi:formylglycine-generating enzyme required for sulfatase activity
VRGQRLSILKPRVAARAALLDESRRAEQGDDHGNDEFQPRQARANGREKSAWDDLTYADFLAGTTTGRSLLRTALVSESGLGKSTECDHLWARLLGETNRLAFRLKVADVPRYTDDFLPVTLAGRLLFHLKSTDRKGMKVHAIRLIEQAAHDGSLVVIFDALDEADANEIARLRDILADPRLNTARTVLAGRAYAFVEHWKVLYGDMHPDKAPGWSFVRLEDLTPKQQESYLGHERYTAVESIERGILGNPRVLYYLRSLPINEVRDIRTASELYWRSTQTMLLGAFDNTARIVQLDQDLANALLAAVAFHTMTSGERPNFMRVESGLPMDALSGRTAGRLTDYYSSLGDRSPRSSQWLKALLSELGRLNTVLTVAKKGRQLAGLQFENRMLQEFFAGLWMARYASADDAKRLWPTIPLPEQSGSRAWYWMWRYAAEMPIGTAAPAPGQVRNPWLLCMEPVYRPGDGTAEGTKRANEIIYRSWETLSAYAAGGQRGASAGHPDARRILDAWRGEFQQILDDPSHAGHRCAHELTNSFVRIPGGTLKMGSPGNHPDRFDNEPKRLKLTIEPYFLCRYPTLNCHYRLFDPGHGGEGRDYPWGSYTEVSPGDRNPAVNTSWYDAWAYSKWVRWNDSSGVHECGLPFEHQWEWAAKGGKDWRRPYWWGHEFDPGRCLSWESCAQLKKQGTATLPNSDDRAIQPYENPYRLLDILGNVWEWCLNVYVDKVRTPSDVTREDRGPFRASRGGGWDSSARICRSAGRSWFSPEYRNVNLGFRLALVRSAEPSRGAE